MPPILKLHRQCQRTVNRLILRVKEDEDEEEVTPGEIHVKIVNLFNYTTDTGLVWWRRLHTED